MSKSILCLGRTIKGRREGEEYSALVIAMAGALLGLLGAVSGRPAWAEAPSKLSPDLVASVNAALHSSSVVASAPTQLGANRLRVIVRPASGVAVDRNLRLRVRSQVSALGRSLPNVGSLVVEATPQQVLALAADPSIGTLSPDRPLSATADLDNDRQSIGLLTTADQKAGGPFAFDGAGVGVAVIDSGIAPVADIADHLVAFKDFVNSGRRPYDDFGHGTHVAGILAGTGISSQGEDVSASFRGVAPGVNLISLKVLDSVGAGSTSNVIAAIEWCIENRALYNIRVINLSLGSGVFESYKTDPLCQAAERAVASGIMVVASAGNWGGVYGGIGAPANDPQVLTVGASNGRGTATRGNDVITTFSSRGPSRFDLSVKPDILAPGNRIVSLRAPGSKIDTVFPETQVAPSEYRSDPSVTEPVYTRLSGTSMAAPFVTGAVALLCQENPGLTPNGIKAALMYSAQLLSGYDPVLRRTGVYDPFTQGAGLVNITGALEMAGLMGPHGLTAWPTMFSVIAGEGVPWAGSTISGLLGRPGSDWASCLLYDPSAFGGDSLWSAGAPWTEGVVWGGTVLWGGTVGDGNKPPTSAFELPQLEDVTWGQGTLWGGSDSAVNYDNLILHGAADGLIATGIWGGTVLWGGTVGDGNKPPVGVTGDDYGNPFGY